ncbi:hypothetical protein TWF481_007736 [Arthrobotrys musiformis]|uniref:Uncharacterized protein n=1 Tax=Arthrobotrys musiformis TaxID=47236 RepID=A0AAV9WCF2_9PEZI
MVETEDGKWEMEDGGRRKKEERRWEHVAGRMGKEGLLLLTDAEEKKRDCRLPCDDVIYYRLRCYLYCSYGGLCPIDRRAEPEMLRTTTEEETVFSPGFLNLSISSTMSFQLSLAAAMASPARSAASTSPERDEKDSKRVKLSSLKHNMGSENILLNTDSCSEPSSCSSLSSPQPQSFSPVPSFANAAGYLWHTLQPPTSRRATELSLNSSDPATRLSVDSFNNLTKDLKFPSWKLDSIKSGDSLLIFGNDDSAPISEIAAPPGPRSRADSIAASATTPRSFDYPQKNWKIASAENNACFVFLETVKGVPPETAIWTDNRHGNHINPTKWASLTMKQNGVYHYTSRPPFAGKFSHVVPNYVCNDSKDSASSMLVQRKGHKQLCNKAAVEGQTPPTPAPEAGVHTGNNATNSGHKNVAAEEERSETPYIHSEDGRSGKRMEHTPNVAEHTGT